jgi:uncharacterized protein YecT (DUF1311 family)
MMRGLLAGFLTLAIAAPIAAQDADGLFYDFGPTAACLVGAQTLPEKSACIGRAADACVEATGYATPVLSGCASRELDDWDARLNAVYQQARARAAQIDKDAFEGTPSQAEALRDMQRAWIPYRDATCAYEASQWGGGTGAGPAFVSCLLTMTGEQALYLELGGLGG